MKFNILSKRYWFFAFSLLLIVPGLIVLAVKGMPLSIDFTGGTMLQLQFAEGTRPEREELQAVSEELGLTGCTVQTSGDDMVIVRSEYLSDETITDYINAIAEKYGQDPEALQYSIESVGPSVGSEVAKRAFWEIGRAHV